MDILLIRHGETERNSPKTFNAGKNRPDPELNANGLKQAALLGKKLAGSGIQAVYASDLLRTHQTAEVIGRYICASVVERADLREIDMGRLHFCSWEELRAETPEICDEWHKHETDLPYPGGESGADAERRAMRALAEIAASCLEKVAVVTHGGIIRVLVCAALGLGQEKRFRIGPPENTSVTTLHYDAGRKEFSVYALNDASHLEKSNI